MTRDRLDRASPIPLYHQIERALLEVIRRRALVAGDLFPSENELAAEFGVTRLTARRAVDRLVQQGVLRRDRGRGTFLAAAPAAAPEPVGTLTLIVPMTSVVHLQTLRGAEAEARSHGFRLVAVHSDADPAAEAGQIEAALAAGTEGLLLWPAAGSASRAPLDRLRAAGVPCVLLDRVLDGVEADQVVVDDFGGAYQATAHLAQLGHRRIALFLYEDTDVSSVRRRRDGYLRALGDHGIEADEALVFHHPIQPSASDLRLMTALAGEAASRPAAPTAAFCVNDHLAQALLIVLHRQGIAVPDRFSIAGFDGLDYLPSHQPLTTVRRATVEMGREAVRLLVDRLRGGIGGPARSVVLPVELVVGETAAPAPGLVAAGP